jgi:hypothetical protein
MLNSPGFDGDPGLLAGTGSLLRAAIAEFAIIMAMLRTAFPMRMPLAFIAATLFSACSTVKPWEKEHLASPCMASPFGKQRLGAEYEDKLMQTKTAGGLPGNAPGGGCGCVQ